VVLVLQAQSENSSCLILLLLVVAVVVVVVVVVVVAVVVAAAAEAVVVVLDQNQPALAVLVPLLVSYEYLPVNSKLFILQNKVNYSTQQ